MVLSTNVNGNEREGRAADELIHLRFDVRSRALHATEVRFGFCVSGRDKLASREPDLRDPAGFIEMFQRETVSRIVPFLR